MTQDKISPEDFIPVPGNEMFAHRERFTYRCEALVRVGLLYVNVEGKYELTREGKLKGMRRLVYSLGPDYNPLLREYDNAFETLEALGHITLGEVDLTITPKGMDKIYRMFLDELFHDIVPRSNIINLKFDPLYEDAVISGEKCCTTRTAVKGKIGNIFQVLNNWYRIVQVIPVLFQTVGIFYKCEGFETPKDFIDALYRIYPSLFQNQMVYLHFFAYVSDECPQFRIAGAVCSGADDLCPIYDACKCNLQVSLEPCGLVGPGCNVDGDGKCNPGVFCPTFPRPERT